MISLGYSQGEDSVEYFLGLTPSGIIVLRNKSTVAHYFWPRIAKVYFKGRYFMIRVCDKNVSAQSLLNYLRDISKNVKLFQLLRDHRTIPVTLKFQANCC